MVLDDSGGLRDRCGDTETEEEEAVESVSPDINGPSSKVRGQDPREHDKDPLQSRGDQTECECSVLGHTGLLEEVHGLVGDEVSRQILCSVHTTDNGGSSEITAFEKLKVRRLSSSRLELDCPMHHGDCVVGPHARASPKSFD